MGQRFLQLNNTYTVSENGTITLHVAQMPPNANIFQPGPALLFVVVNGVPSNGTMLTVGSGDFGTQPLGTVADLPASVNATVSNSGGGGNNGGGGSNGGSGGGTNNDTHTSSLSSGVKIGIAAGGAIVSLFLGGLLLLCIRRRKQRSAAERTAKAGGVGGMSGPGMAYRSSVLADREGRGSNAFIPLQQYNNSAWDIPSSTVASHADLHAPMLYNDDPRASQDTRLTGPEHVVEYKEEYYDRPPPPRFASGRAM
jgi:hypothetical protein